MKTRRYHGGVITKSIFSKKNTVKSITKTKASLKNVDIQKHYEKITTKGETIISCDACGRFLKPIRCFNKSSNWAFLFFLKRLIMQPYIREYFVKKYNPGIFYAMIKLDYNDKNKTQKLNFIEKLIKSKDDFIMDLAVQLSEGGGGHYTSLKRQNGYIEYMDSDSFVYGMAYGGDESDDRLSRMLKKIPNPVVIFGDDNKDEESMLKAKRSIQNLHPSYDTFCQSWSLLFITVANELPNIHEQLRFQLSDYGIIEHHSYLDSLEEIISEDDNMTEVEKKMKIIEIQQRKKVIEEKENQHFEMFIKNNFNFLLNFWVILFRDVYINQLLQSQTINQFKNWSSETICNKIIEISEYLSKKKLRDERKVNDTTFSFDREELKNFMTNK